MISTPTSTKQTSQSLWLTLSSAQQTLLKWLALALMLLDHANRTLWSFQPWLFTVGRLAFPLFAFLIAYNIAARGVKVGRYVLPLLIFGVISQAPAMLALDRELLPLNIFFTLLLGSSLLPLQRWFARQLPEGWLWWSLSRLVSVYLVLLFGVMVEYGPLGVLLISSLVLLLRRPSFIAGMFALVLLVFINALQVSSLSTLLTLPVIYAVSILKLPRLPRLKWFFMPSIPFIWFYFGGSRLAFGKKQPMSYYTT